MQHSESISKLAAALCKVQGEIENATKSASNPFFGSKYADLAEIIDTARPVLTKYGLSIMQLPGFEGGVVTLDNVLIHESGEWISGMSGAPLPVMTKKNGEVLPPSPQGVGSAITYLRRYSLAAICMIAQEDDDGNASRETAGHYAAPAAHSPAATPPEQPMSKQVGSARDGFSVDTVVGKGKHKDTTWKQLGDTEEGRNYITWILSPKGWTTLSPAQRTALEGLIATPKGSATDSVLLQDLLNQAATVDAITIEQAARIEKVIDDSDADAMSAARDWLSTQIQKKKLGAGV